MLQKILLVAGKRLLIIVAISFFSLIIIGCPDIEDGIEDGIRIGEGIHNGIKEGIASVKNESEEIQRTIERERELLVKDLTYLMEGLSDESVKQAADQFDKILEKRMIELEGILERRIDDASEEIEELRKKIFIDIENLIAKLTINIDCKIDRIFNEIDKRTPKLFFLSLPDCYQEYGIKKRKYLKLLEPRTKYNIYKCLMLETLSEDTHIERIMGVYEELRDSALRMAYCQKTGKEEYFSDRQRFARSYNIWAETQ